MSTKAMALIAAGAAALVCAAPTAATPVQTTSYPWVQLPAWVGTGVAPPATGPSVSYPWVQPPAWVPVR